MTTTIRVLGTSRVGSLYNCSDLRIGGFEVGSLYDYNDPTLEVPNLWIVVGSLYACSCPGFRQFRVKP